MPKALFKSDDELFEAIQRCRTSGMTDKDWCAANGISQTALYRYIRKLKKKSYEIPNHTRFRKQEVVPVQIVPDGQESLPSTIPEQRVFGPSFIYKWIGVYIDIYGYYAKIIFSKIYFSKNSFGKENI